jgi:acetyltransferase-like isoleucine patch superfamily enzyme
MRGFTQIQAILSVVMILLMGVLWGLPIAPALYVFDWLTSFGPGDRSWLDLMIIGFSVSIAFLTWGMFLLLLSGVLQFLMRLRFEDRIVVPLASLTTIRWAICGQIHRSTQPFLSHIVPSFFANAYYRLAGCKIGKNVNINSVTINDPSLVELGDNVVVGGGATLNGHLVEKGNLVLEKVIVGSNSTVGGATMVGPGARIGENCILGSRAVLAKRKVIPDGEIWVGIPARPISSLHSASSK